MHEADLHLEPNEASDLTPLFGPQVLAERKWGLALATVLDESPVEDAIAVLLHDVGASVAEGWHARRVAAKASQRTGATNDAEACATRDGWLYVVGSQFGSKTGPLEPARSFIARVREDDIFQALTEGAEAAMAAVRPAPSHQRCLGGGGRRADRAGIADARDVYRCDDPGRRARPQSLERPSPVQRSPSQRRGGRVP
jgi:hypothetical protein